MVEFSRIKSLLNPVLLVLLAFFASLIFYLTQLYSWQLEQQGATRFFQQSFNASINQYEYLPALLAQDNRIKSVLSSAQQSATALNQYLKFVAQRSAASDVYVMDTSGRAIAASNYDQPNSFLNQNYSFRPYFARAISQHKRQFYYAIGATTGIPGFFISAPVMDFTETVLGVVVVKLDLREWEQSWQEAGQNILVADNNQVVILSGLSKWRYRSIGPLQQKTLDEIEAHRQFQGILPVNLYSQQQRWSYFKKFPVSFWHIDGDTFLVNSTDIADTGWTLYHLKKNNQLIYSAIIFFLVILTGLILSHLYLRERKSKIRSTQLAAENELRHRQELEIIIQKIQIGVVSITQSGEILFLNDAARKILQLGEADKQQHSVNIQQLLDVSSIKSFDELLKNTGDIIKPYHETTVLNQGRGVTHVMFAISQVPIEGEKRLLMTLINIEKRKQAEEAVTRINASLEQQVESRTQALRDAQAELVQQSKVAALGQMAATIVHELSQPLSAMNSSIAAIRLKAENKDWSGALKSISRLAPLNQKMHNVIKLLKSFSYQDEQVVERQQLAPLISQSLTLYKDSLREKNIEINLLEMPKSVFVKVNPLKLDLVIVNIIQNAIDAMDKCTQPSITVGLTVEKQQALITIEDMGGGINSRVMGQLFNPYFTTKEIGKGLGLGLSICYEIIQEYSGTIDAENTEQGARFIIRLPLDEGKF